ncbi:IPT/TIG domain-containing protein [Nonomuraea sp. NPDC055795]
MIGVVVVVVVVTLWMLYHTLWAKPVIVLVPVDPPTTDRGEWMAPYGANGAQLTKTQANAKTAAVPVADPIVRVAENLYIGRRFDGTGCPVAKRELCFPKDAQVRKTLLDACFPNATIAGVSPATGAAAGGDSITIRGTDITPGGTVTFGGTAATNIVVVDERTITCKTPAKGGRGGHDRAGTVTKADGFSYA